MVTRLQKAITAWTPKQALRGEQEFDLYLLSTVAVLFCLLIHASHLLLFLYWNEAGYVLLNVGSVCLYTSLVMLLRLRKYTLANVLLVAEALLYATLMTVANGVTNMLFGYILLVIVLQTVIPYGSVRLRAMLVVVAFACLTGALIWNFGPGPIHPFAPGLQNILMVSNTFLLFLGILMELYLRGFVHSIVEKVTESQMAELTTKAYIDPLTGLYNRRYADEYLNGHLGATGRGYCVAMVDIDHFKKVNDTYGHGCGDEVLQGFATFLRSRVRSSDVVFRWGGEEFLLVLYDVDLPLAHELLDRMRRQLSALPLATNKGEIHITFTVGVCALENGDLPGAIEKSDNHLYLGKHKGRNMVISRVDEAVPNTA